jgi:hypothetical protein
MCNVLAFDKSKNNTYSGLWWIVANFIRSLNSMDAVPVPHPDLELCNAGWNWISP